MMAFILGTYGMVHFSQDGIFKYAGASNRDRLLGSSAVIVTQTNRLAECEVNQPFIFAPDRRLESAGETRETCAIRTKTPSAISAE